MFLSLKSKIKQSSRRQIKIKEVKDNMLILPNKQYRTVIETSSVNFELRSEKEQDVLLDNFQNFLNALPCSIQILIRIREVAVNEYLEDITKIQKDEKSTIDQLQKKYYAEFIQKLIAENNVFSRHFYLITSYQATGTDDETEISEQLLINQDIIIKGLERLGIKGRPLNSIEIVNLFYTFYNSKTAKTQPLTKAIISTYE